MRTYDTDIIDEELLQRCERGDRGALDTLIRACQTLVYSLAARLLGRKDEAEDATQEAFLRIYNNLHRFDRRARFTTWAGAIVTNVCLDRLRQRKLQRRHSAEDEPDSIPAFAPSTEEVVANRDMMRIVTGLVHLLPEKQRMVFVLRDLEDFTVDEVTAMTGLSRGSVKTNLHYARRELRRRLINDYHIQEAG